MSRLAGLLLAGLVVLAACTSGTAGPVPTPAALAPPVASHKDARGVDPCALLTATQLEGLGLSPATGRRNDSSGLIGCGWDSIVFGYGVVNTLDTEASRQGLTSLYRGRSDYELFEPLEIDGYPAVRAQLANTGDCTIYVGVSDIQVLSVLTNAIRKIDACSITKRAISAMLTNLPAQR